MLIFVDLTGSLPKTTTLGSTPTEGSPITEELTKTARVIVLSACRPFTASDYPFDIFKLLLEIFLKSYQEKVITQYSAW
jgi:hypothetical protein